MSRRLGPRVPETVRRLLDDEPARQVGLTILVVTVGDAGWPHLAMVSVGEVVPIAQDRLALALWPSSTSAANLARARLATLALVADGRAFSLLCRSGHERMLEVDDHPQTRAFDLRVSDATEDAAPYADLLSGVTYRLHDREPALARWSATRAALGAAFG